MEETDPAPGVSRLTLHVEQLVLDGDLRAAAGLGFAVDHPLVVRMGLQIHEASLQVVEDVRPVDWDLLGWELPVERDLGRRHRHATRDHSLSAWVQVDNVEVAGRRDKEFSFLCKGEDRVRIRTPRAQDERGLATPRILSS